MARPVTVRESCCDCTAFDERGREVRAHVEPCIYAPEADPVTDLIVALKESVGVPRRAPKELPQDESPHEGPYIDICSADDPEWKPRRRHRVGASESAAILGVPGAWGGPYSVYGDKVLPPKEDDDDEKKLAGRVLEEAIAELARLKLGAKEKRRAARLLGSTIYPHLGCTLDYWVLHPIHGWIPLECKNTTESDDWRDDDRPPPHVWVQCQHQLAVTGEPIMVCAVLLWGYQLKCYEVPRDEKFITGTLVPETTRLWGHVEAGTRPDPDPSKECTATIKRLFPDAEPEKWLLVDEVTDYLDVTYFGLKEQADHLAERMADIKNQMRDKLENAEGVVMDDGRKWSHRGKNGKRKLLPPRKAAA